jgi:CMP/dCMP kinase
LYQDDTAVVDSLDHFVNVLLEVVRSSLLEMLVDQDIDGILGGGTEPLTHAAMVRKCVVAANLRMFGKFAGHACAIQRTTREFENESLHGALLYAKSDTKAEARYPRIWFRGPKGKPAELACRCSPPWSKQPSCPKTSPPGTMNEMIVTIDGPAGAGKSTVARALARRLGYCYLDTGAMYRAVALAGLQAGVDWSRPEQMVSLVSDLDLLISHGRILLHGEDVTEAVRTQAVTSVTRFAANHPDVRARLVLLQQSMAAGHNVVTEGRDQGTVVFPQAACKIFLTATPEERARRRLRDIEQHGESATLSEILAAQECRDHEDANREVGPLLKAGDAVEVITDGMTQDQVVDRLEELVRSRMPANR